MRVAALATLLLGACATTRSPGPTDAFFARLTALCGKAFAGRVVSTDAVDAGMRSQALVMHVRECSPDQIRIPFLVGADRSRTWIITQDSIIAHLADHSDQVFEYLTLKHDHRHEDGSADVLTDYGGSARDSSPHRQEFSADQDSRTRFASNGNPALAANVWAMEVEPGRMFAYELRRPGRFFRAEFDLSRPVPAPPPPWGAR